MIVRSKDGNNISKASEYKHEQDRSKGILTTIRTSHSFVLAPFAACTFYE